MKIAMIHFRVGELDGVSLEMDKWKKVLVEELNHEVIYLAGDLGKTNGLTIPELSLNYKPGLEIRELAFGKQLDKEQEELLRQRVEKITNELEKKLEKFISDNSIELLIPNNVLSLPINIPASLALARVIQKTHIPTIIHNHDFFWERTVYNPSCTLIEGYLEKYFPIGGKNISNVVINSLAQTELQRRKGFASTIVPNVFYFEDTDWTIDDFNKDIRDSLGIQENDILILQATRIVDRKGIELVIDLIAEMNKPETRKKLVGKELYNGKTFTDSNKIVFVFPNLVEDIPYKERLEKRCNERHIDYIFCNDKFGHERSADSESIKKYSLWDIYVHSDIVSYPSLLEGWGNQFLEAVKARLPIITYEYPVYRKDIGPQGFKVISLGHEHRKDAETMAVIPQNILLEAVDETITYLQDTQLRKDAVDTNYNIGLKQYSLEALKKYISPLLP